MTVKNPIYKALGIVGVVIILFLGVYDYINTKGKLRSLSVQHESLIASVKEKELALKERDKIVVQTQKAIAQSAKDMEGYKAQIRKLENENIKDNPCNTLNPDIDRVLHNAEKQYRVIP